MPTIGILYGVGLIELPTGTVTSASGTYPAFYGVSLAPLTFASAGLSQLTPGTVSLSNLTVYRVHFGGTST